VEPCTNKTQRAGPLDALDRTFLSRLVRAIARAPQLVRENAFFIPDEPWFLRTVVLVPVRLMRLG
jgi:hypothetical protein